MEPLSRSSKLILDPTDNAEIVSVMKGRRAINQYESNADDLDWGEHGIGRIHRTCGPEDHPHIKGRYENL